MVVVDFCKASKCIGNRTKVIWQVVKWSGFENVVGGTQNQALSALTTSAFNQAVKRNSDRFPEDFAFQLTQLESDDLKSQIVISKPGSGGRRFGRRVSTPGELVEQLGKLAETVKWHDKQIDAIKTVLQQMLDRPIRKKRRIGFQSDDESP